VRTKPFTVYQPVPGQNPKPLFTVSTPIRSNRPARSSRQRSRARPSLSAQSRSTEQANDPRYPQRSPGDGLRQRDAEGDQAQHGARGDGILRMMCRSPKSRAGCHFAAAIGLRAQLEGYAPTIPDWANDQHTLAGRKLGRGLDHFHAAGAKLIPPPTDDDPYENEAYRLWALKQQGKQKAKPADLFDE
jgi:hypothetical protein